MIFGLPTRINPQNSGMKIRGTPGSAYRFAHRVRTAFLGLSY